MTDTTTSDDSSVSDSRATSSGVIFTSISTSSTWRGDRIPYPDCPPRLRTWSVVSRLFFHQLEKLVVDDVVVDTDALRLRSSLTTELKRVARFDPLWEIVVHVPLLLTRVLHERCLLTDNTKQRPRLRTSVFSSRCSAYMIVMSPRFCAHGGPNSSLLHRINQMIRLCSITRVITNWNFETSWKCVADELTPCRWQWTIHCISWMSLATFSYRTIPRWETTLTSTIPSVADDIETFSVDTCQQHVRTRVHFLRTNRIDKTCLTVDTCNMKSSFFETGREMPCVRHTFFFSFTRSVRKYLSKSWTEMRRSGTLRLQYGSLDDNLATSLLSCSSSPQAPWLQRSRWCRICYTSEKCLISLSTDDAVVSTEIMKTVARWSRFQQRHSSGIARIRCLSACVYARQREMSIKIIAWSHG